MRRASGLFGPTLVSLQAGKWRRAPPKGKPERSVPLNTTLGRLGQLGDKINESTIEAETHHSHRRVGDFLPKNHLWDTKSKKPFEKHARSADQSQAFQAKQQQQQPKQKSANASTSNQQKTDIPKSAKPREPDQPYPNQDNDYEQSIRLGREDGYVETFRPRNPKDIPWYGSSRAFDEVGFDPRNSRNIRK